MRQFIILILFLFISIFTSAQSVNDYNRWSISADYGIHMIADKSSTSMSSFGSFGGDIRYNINPKLGIGLSGGTDIVDLKDFYFNKIGLTYSRINFETYVNVLNMVDFYSGRFAALFHGGPGVSHVNTNNGYNQILPNLRGGFTMLFKLTQRVSLKTDMSVVSNFAATRTIDGSFDNANTGVNSMIANATVGLSIALGKNKKHLDNYVPEKVEPTITYVTNVTNVIDTTITNNNYITNNYVFIDSTQYVFFENDKYEIRNSELNSIYKTYINLISNPKYTVTVNGWASPTSDLNLRADSDKYNLELSKNRSEVVKQKLMDMGISEDRIQINYFGKHKTFSNVNIHDVARMVELVVHKK